MKYSQWRRYFDRRNRPAWVVLILCLGVMMLAWYNASTNQARSAHQQFALHVRDVVIAIENRLRQHEQILLGGAGLYDASISVDRNEWHTYVERLNLSKNYPGILGVGYSAIIQPADLAAHEAAIRAEGFPQFTVKPAGKRPLYSSIVYLEPFSGRNLAAFGYDMLSESTRSKAMRMAAETGNTAISGRVTLVQETHGKVQAGFLMYVPIYRKNLPLGTAKERWKALQGFVYSPYRADDLMNGIMGERIPEVDFTIFDGENENEKALMYTTIEPSPNDLPRVNQPQFSALRTIQAYGQTWTIRFQSRPGFDKKFRSSAGLAAVSLGGSTSALLFFLVTFLIFRREQAEELAGKMTAKIRLNEERLRVSEERFELAVRASNDGIWDWNIVNGEFYCSPRFKTLLGIKTNDAVSDFSFFERRFHPDDKAATLDALKKHLEEDEIFDVTCRLQISSGSWRWFRICGIAERDTEGRPVRMVGSILDITERKVAERTLQESHSLTQTILDNVIDGIITINKSGIIQSVNRSGENIFNYEAAEIIGKNVNMLMPEPYRSQHNGYLKNYLNTGIAKIIGMDREVEGMRKDGSIFPLDLAVSQITHQGQPLFIGMARDITERKKYDRMKTEFVSTVSHELRTPLTSIKGALSLVLSKAGDDLPKKVSTMLQTAYRNSERLTLLINDILDLEKIQSGRLQFEFKPVDMVTLAQQALVVNESYAQQHNVKMRLITDVDVAIVWGDEHRLQQVFANLLSNAVKFSPSEGEVIIRISRHGQTFRVSIKDCGRGIPFEFRDRVFQRFAQADSSDTREKGGTGLGLSITKAIVDRHVGVIDYTSEEGEGSEFYFELPQWREVIETDGTGESANKVLICEDDQDTANILAGILAQDGLAADIAGTVRAARELLLRKSYSLLMLDVGLPDGNGIEFMQELMNERTIPELPVIVVTGRPAMAHSEFRMGSLSIVDWLQKPIDRARLSRSLQKALLRNSRPRILHVESDRDTIGIIEPLIEEIGEYVLASTLNEAEARLASEKFDLVLLNITFPEGNALELVTELQGQCPVVLFTGQDVDIDLKGKFAAMLHKSSVSKKHILETIKQNIKRAG